MNGKIVLYKSYLVSLQKCFVMEQQTKGIKVVHVHFLHGHKNYYFGSVSAIFRKFSADDMGISEIRLRHQLSNDGNHYINKKVFVIRSRMIR